MKSRSSMIKQYSMNTNFFTPSHNDNKRRQPFPITENPYQRKEPIGLIAPPITLANKIPAPSKKTILNPTPQKLAASSGIIEAEVVNSDEFMTFNPKNQVGGLEILD